MAKRWLVLEVRSTSAEHTDVLTEGLMALGADAVIESGPWLSTWLPVDDTAEKSATHATIAHARERLEAVAGASLEWRWSVREEQDWAKRWRDGLEARRVSDRIVVTPSWVDHQPRDGEITLTIDPQMAFGTGEHASTRGALRLVEAAIRPGVRVLDVGTGSAILAIAATLLGAARVDAVEYDPDALINARENVGRHGCEGRVHLHEAFVDLDYLAGTAATTGCYGVIAGNVLSGVLVPLLPGFRAILCPAGSLILAGIMASEADAVIEAAEAHGFRLVREDRDEDWWSGSFTTPSHRRFTAGSTA